MNERVYTINEIKNLISESVNEFKAKVGDKVENSNKKERQLPNKEDGNKTTLDYALEGNPGDDFRKKVKAQAEGYTSTLEKNNKIEKEGDFNDKTYQQFKKAGKEMADNKVKAKQSGLTARTLPKSTFEKDSIYESSKMPFLIFKKTTFLNESQMLSKIPDEYKNNGKRFKVKDASDNEFIVEWADGEGKILFHENKKKLNETMEKFHKLIDYSSKKQFTTSSPKTRINETNSFNTILNKARTIAEKK